MRVQRRGARRRHAGFGHVAAVLAVVVALMFGTVGTTLFATVTSQPQQAAAAKKTEKAGKDAKKADESKKSKAKPGKAKKKADKPAKNPATDPAEDPVTNPTEDPAEVTDPAEDPATDPNEADKGAKKGRKGRKTTDATSPTAEVAASSALKREPVFKKSTKSRGEVSAASTGGLTTTQNTADLATTLGGADIEVFNATTGGAEAAMGLFEGGIIGFPSGIILSTGDIANVVGPNSSWGISGSNGTGGDADLDQLAGETTQDAAVLEFDFVPVGDVVAFRYIFASEEYNEFVDAGYNDVFGFFVNGKNCATVGGQPVSVDTINLSRNAGSFRDNEAGTLNTEMDGLTRVLTCRAEVTPHTFNHAKLVIADVGDDVYDSAVFLQADSFMNCPVDPSLPVHLAPRVQFHKNEVAFPMSTGYFINNSALMRHHDAAEPETIMPMGSITDASALAVSPYTDQYAAAIVDQTLMEEHRKGWNDGGVYLDFRDGQTYWQGNKSKQVKAPVYYRYIPCDSLVYWFHYGRSINIPSNVAHEGDWERLVITLDEKNKPDTVRWHHHFDYTEREWDEAPKVKGTQHPMVWVGLGSHASYPEKGSYDCSPWYIFWTSVCWDYAKGGGPKWDTWKVSMQDVTKEPWWGYNGNWGSTDPEGALCPGLSGTTCKSYGPVGPSLYKW